MVIKNQFGTSEKTSAKVLKVQLQLKGCAIRHFFFKCQIKTLQTHTSRQTSMLLNFPTSQNCCHKASVHVLVSHFGSVALIKENLSIITLIPSNPSTSASRRLFDIFLWHSWNCSSEPKHCRVNCSLTKKSFVEIHSV